MIGWHHQLDGYEFEQVPGVGEGQGGLASLRGRKESDTTEQLNWTDTAFCMSATKFQFLFLLGALTTLWASLVVHWQRIHLQCRRCGRSLGFNPWVRKIPWRKKRQPTSEFLLEKSHGQRRLVGYMWSQKSQTHSVTKQQWKQTTPCMKGSSETSKYSSSRIQLYLELD